MPAAIPSSVADFASRNGGNLLGLAKAPQVWYEWYINWRNPADDEAVKRIAGRVTAKVTKAAKKKGVLLPYLFMNTAGNKQNVLAGYGSGNLDEIKRVAKRYDPDQVFQRLQGDGYLVRDA